MQNEFIQSPPDNREDNEKALLQLAESFDPGEARRSVLYQYKRGVLLLRAKHATYDKIVTMLEKVGVKTSLFSVSRFCRQHRAEIKKPEAAGRRFGAVAAGQPARGARQTRA
jgi:hypothetical protein